MADSACLYAEPEVRAEDAYEWTQGRAVFADRKRRDAVSRTITTADGQEFQPSTLPLRDSSHRQCCSSTIFVSGIAVQLYRASNSI